MKSEDLKTKLHPKANRLPNKSRADLHSTRGDTVWPELIQITLCLAQGGFPPGRELAGQSSGSGALRLELEHSLLCSENPLRAVSVERDSLPHLEGNRLQVQLTGLREANSLTLMLSASKACAVGADRFAISRTRREPPRLISRREIYNVYTAV